MARKRVILLHPLQTFVKHFVLGLSLTFLIILAHSQAELSALSIVQSAPNSQHSYAQTLTQKGFKQLHHGQAQEALQTWEEAYQSYKQLDNSEGMKGSLINQSLALQALGLYPRACRTLIQALKLEDWICTSPIQQVALNNQKQKLIEALQKQPILLVQVIGLLNLGEVLRLIGKPDTSEFVLQQALVMARDFSSVSRIQNHLLLSLANTERTLYNRAKNKYQLTDEPIAKQKALKVVQSKFNIAMELYQENSTELQAQLNQLSLLLESKQLLASDRSTNTALIQNLVKQLLAAHFEQLPAIESIYARLNLIHSLIKISQDVEFKKTIFADNTNVLNIALSLIDKPWELSQKIDNERAESYTLGTKSIIYSHLGQLIQSKEFLNKALALAQSVQAWDIAYQWQQLLGRLYKQIGDFDKAMQAYAAATTSLDQVQGNLLSVNPDIQFSFKDKVEPVYQEYIELLLSKPQPDLKQAIQVKERLQLAELENFLQCSQRPIISLSNIQTSTAVPPTIYLMKLEKRVEVIVRTKEGLLYRHTVTTDLVNDHVENLLDILQYQRFLDIEEAKILVYSKALYRELFAPIKKYLPNSGTLIFVPDSYFQNLPIAMLHDGENYLIKSYNISIALGSSLWQPQVLKPEQLKVLIAGISEKSPSFKEPLVPKNLSPLPEVATEVAKIRANTVSTKELLNAEFTSEHFQQRIEADHLPVTHITTHGQFSSDPEQTFILTWDKVINVRQLNLLLRKQQKRSTIELLVLSACQTAKGDRHSALGIAGVAVQAGARSTLATLWLVDADSTAELMGEFYKGLKNGLSKAEALRQAQLTLLSNPRYSHPFYWGCFILVGSWL